VQVAPVIEYAWDSSVTLNTGTASDMDLSADMELATPSSADEEDCKLDECASFNGSSYFPVPAYDYGLHPGLTFAMWLKPSADGGSGACILDVGDTAKNQSITIARNGTTSNLVFSVRRSKSRYAELSVPNLWAEPGEWRHVTWTLKPTGAGGDAATWNIYLNGIRTATFVGLYPANGSLTVGYLGKSLSSDQGFFVGYMDHFQVFPYTKSTAMAQELYRVRLSTPDTFVRIFIPFSLCHTALSDPCMTSTGVSITSNSGRLQFRHGNSCSSCVWLAFFFGVFCFVNGKTMD
jgi:hypothetical protein